MRKIIVIIAFLSLNLHALGQSAAGTVATLETLFGVEMPTAGVLGKGVFASRFIAYEGGGGLLMAEYSPLTNLMFGISYGANGFIGNGDAKGQELPGVSLRWRFLDETLTIPAVAIGFSNQGRGVFRGQEFRTQSPGFYVSTSKSFTLLGTAALHGGIHYSIEPRPDDRGINFYLAAEKSIGKYLSVAVEFNPTLQANEALIARRGLLQTALRASLGRGLTAELQVLDVLGHIRDDGKLLRVFSLEYVERF